MNRRYFYAAELQDGSTFETDIESNTESIANTEAKIELERWLHAEGQSADRLVAFDLVFREPA